MYITIEQIYQKTTPEDIFKHYLKVSEITSKPISSPFREDKKPSFSIYRNTWTFTDFGDIDKKGNCFNLVAELNNLTSKKDFNKVLNLINDDMSLGIINEKKFKNKKVNWSKSALQFWSEYGVAEDILKLMNVSQFKTQKNGFGFSFNSNNENKYKEYIPKQKTEDKSFPFNSFTQKDIIGLENLSKEENIIITAGEKDRVVLYANTEIKGVNFTSETTKISPEQIEVLKNKSVNIFICYDNDTTGKKSVNKIIEQYKKDIIVLHLPSGVNDIADYFQKGYSSQSFIDLMSDALNFHRVENDTNLWAKDNCYYAQKPKKKEWEIVKISNFIIENPYLITSDLSEAKRLIKIITTTGETDYLSIDTNRMSSLQQFKSMIESQGNYFWFGNDTDLSNFKELVLGRSKVVRRAEILGFDNGSESYAFTNFGYKNQLIEPNEFSVIDIDNQGLWIDKDYQKTNVLEYKNTKNVDLQQWFNQVEKAYGTEKAFFGCTYVAMCVLFDVITDEYGHFPLLFIYGRPASGKTEFAKFMRKVFFPNTEKQTSLQGATPVAMSNIISQFSNALIHFDEYKSNIKNLEIVTEKLKNIFDLIGRDKSTTSNDNKTYSDEVKSGLVVTGEHMPQDNALSSRVILMTFDKTHNTDTSDEFDELKVLTKKGLSKIITDVFDLRDQFKKEIKDNRKRTVNDLETLINENDLNLDKRVINNYSLFLMVYDALNKGGLIVLDRNKVLKSMLETMSNQGSLLDEIDYIKVFWQTFENHRFIDINPEHHFVQVKDLTALSQICIGEIVRLAKRSNPDFIDENTMRDYLKNDKAFVKKSRNQDKATFNNGRKRAVWFESYRIKEQYDIELSERV